MGTIGEIISVLLELRVPQGAAALKGWRARRAAFELAEELGSHGFQIDRGYEPVPMEASTEREEAVYLLRGTVDEDRMNDLEANPAVEHVWRDTRVEPFIPPGPHRPGKEEGGE